MVRNVSLKPLWMSWNHMKSVQTICKVPQAIVCSALDFLLVGRNLGSCIGLLDGILHV
jgi:hypothetical protein